MKILKSSARRGRLSRLTHSGSRLASLCHGTLLIAVSALPAACGEEDYKLYDTQQADHVFFDYKNSSKETDSILSYNFGYDISETHTVGVPVSLMGMPAGRDRAVGIRAVADSTDMVEGVHYEIERAVLRAGHVSDTILVRLLRPDDPAFHERALRLYLQIDDNEDLCPTGQSTFTILSSDIHPAERPAWWHTWEGLPEYSFEHAQLFFKYFYDLAPKADKEVFDEMIEAYGDYFVNAGDVQGPFDMYGAFLAKYVTIPMYNDTKDIEGFVWQKVPTVN